jgi:hypothetical protein
MLIDGVRLLCAEDGWGDDTWGGFEPGSSSADAQVQLSANLRYVGVSVTLFTECA